MDAAAPAQVRRRPINNVVDVTNYVMIELGIPLHAYDYDRVVDHHLIARRAKEGEDMKTLDGVDRKLSGNMLVIADPAKPCCIAGIMGGYDSEVTADTKTVILECASFKGSSIRHTGRALGLRSEASARFERGLDAEGCIASLDRCAQLLQQMGACDVARASSTSIRARSRRSAFPLRLPRSTPSSARRFRKNR